MELLARPQEAVPRRTIRFQGEPETIFEAAELSEVIESSARLTSTGSWSSSSLDDPHEQRYQQRMSPEKL